MFWNLSRGFLGTVPLGFLLISIPALATTDVVVPAVEIGKGASLSAGNNAVTVPVEVQCSARWEVLEAFVYIVQNSSQSSNAPIPVDCGMDRPRLYNVQVSAGPAPFEQGEAVATAYVLLQDTSSGSTIPLNDTATIIIRPVTGKTAPSER